MDTAQLPAWIVATQWASRLILILLGGLSIWSVSIMIDRARAFRSFGEKKGLGDAEKFIFARDWTGLKAWAKASPHLVAKTLTAALDTGSQDHESVDRAVRSYLSLEKSKLERGLTALATLGSNAPFIGLFGTVLGIIQAFGSLANSSNTSSVMSGISEALVATAVGLFVAIPAVIAYNVFSRKLRLALVECESLRDLYLSRLGTPAGQAGKP
jgi:biopolymer transport protein ExbB/TolQ